jgi:hypothetical protein
VKISNGVSGSVALGANTANDGAFVGNLDYGGGSNQYTFNVQFGHTVIKATDNNMGAITGSAFVAASGASFAWTSTSSTASTLTLDTGLCRGGVAIVYASDGASTCDNNGSVLSAAIATKAVVTASLPTCTASVGTPWRASVSDATAPALGVALTGGGAVFANVHCSLTTGTYIVDGL